MNWKGQVVPAGSGTGKPRRGRAPLRLGFPGASGKWQPPPQDLCS